METLARELERGVDIICVGYHYYKDEDIFPKARVLADRIQKFCGSFLQGDIYGLGEEEYQALKEYVIGVLEDYLEALEKRDVVYMLDTLDYGLRELLNIYIDKEKEDSTDAEEGENG